MTDEPVRDTKPHSVEKGRCTTRTAWLVDRHKSCGMRAMQIERGGDTLHLVNTNHLSSIRVSLISDTRKSGQSLDRLHPTDH
jgi:hypothetical protein